METVIHAIYFKKLSHLPLAWTPARINHCAWHMRYDMSPCTGNMVNTNYDQVLNCGWLQNLRDTIRHLMLRDQHAAQSAMTRPSKRIATSWGFDSIIIKRCYDQRLSNDLHFSCKAKHCTVMCPATPKEFTGHYFAKCSQVYRYVCMLDANKAFSKMDFVELFESLFRRHVYSNMCMFYAINAFDTGNFVKLC